jgi:hypothetical protein
MSKINGEHGTFKLFNVLMGHVIVVRTMYNMLPRDK